MPKFEHWVVRVRGFGEPSLLGAERAQWLWSRLRRAFPRALACVLMDDHVHLVISREDPRALRGILGGFAKRFGTRLQLTTERLNTTAIARRAVRYVLLNPVRAGLVSDPWCWQWSTLRDLGGAAHPIWTAPERVARALECSPAELLSVVTHSADASALAPTRVEVDVASVDSVVRAVATVCRIPESEVLSTRVARRLAVQTLFECGGPSVPVVARQLGLSVRAVRYLSEPRHPALDAVLLCLGDARLRGGAPLVR